MTRQHNGQRLEDTKGVIRSSKSKNDKTTQWSKVGRYQRGNQKP